MLKFLNSLELIANDTIAGLVPWLAPIPTAYSVFRAGYAGLGWPAWVATLGALAIEGLGVSAASTAMMLYSYEQDRGKSQPSALRHFALAASAGGLYLVSALALIGLVEVAGVNGPARYVPIVFPFLSLAAVIILALRADHRRRLIENEKAKSERSTKRQEARQSKTESANVAPPVVSVASKRDRLKWIATEGRQASANDIVSRFSISLRQAQRDIAQSRRENGQISGQSGSA